MTTLRGARRVLTVCHENPEADALGSALAHALLVEALGGTRLAHLRRCRAADVRLHARPRRASGAAPEPGVAYDLIVVGDCGELERVGPLLRDHAELFGRVPILDIDHHKSNPGFGAVDWIDPSAAATCEMTTLLAARLEVPLDAAGGQLAASLMAGLVIDTATFQHPNTTPRTLRVAAELVAAGAPLYETSRRLYRTKPNRQLQLFGLVLARLESAADGRLVWSRLEDADLAATGQ